MLVWCVGWALAAPSLQEVAVEVASEIAVLPGEEARPMVREVLVQEGISVGQGSGLALRGTLRSEDWMFRQGLLQVELVVAWELEEDGEVVYQGETRGLCTRAVRRSVKARRHRRTGTLAATSVSGTMRLDALRSAARTVAGRKSFREALTPEPADGSAVDDGIRTVVDFADRPGLGIAPPALRDPVVRSGTRRRTAGIVVTTVGLLTTMGAVGSYFVSAHVPRNELQLMRVMELSGWGMMATGGVLWFHGDKRSRSWR
ncbi:MAG: hypothetical protein KTR31_09730 [Myxococcales bacterium]|nr:hypothetical protein [Myxococcales bacterium]